MSRERTSKGKGGRPSWRKRRLSRGSRPQACFFVVWGGGGGSVLVVWVVVLFLWCVCVCCGGGEGGAVVLSPHSFTKSMHGMNTLNPPPTYLGVHEPGAGEAPTPDSMASTHSLFKKHTTRPTPPHPPHPKIYGVNTLCPPPPPPPPTPTSTYLGMHEPGAGEAREAGQVDVALLPGVVPRDVAWVRGGLKGLMGSIVCGGGGGGGVCVGVVVVDDESHFGGRVIDG